MQKFTFEEAIKEAQKLNRQFEEHDPQPWNEETKVADLASHIGKIAQGILEKQGKKPVGADAVDLGQNISIVMFVLLDLCEAYGIDFESEFLRFLDLTRAQLPKEE